MEIGRGTAPRRKIPLTARARSSPADRHCRSTMPRVSAANSDGPTVLIMAAGEGTRMHSSMPKVLHPVCGRPMVAWPVLAARDAGAGRIAVIVSPDRDLTSGLPEGTETVIQPEADGTGGAVRAAHDIVRDSDTVVVLSGDHPLITGEIVSALLETHRAAGAGGHRDDGRARRPGRLRTHRPRRRRRHRARSSRPRTPRRSRPRSSRSARSTPAPTSSTPSR